MYSTPHQQVPTTMSNIGGGIIDGSGTINPAALNSGAPLASAPSMIGTDSSPRGLKRSRSPDHHNQIASTGDTGDDNDDGKPRKRGRPPKGGKAAGNPSESPNQSTIQHPGALPTTQVQTPQAQPKALPPTATAGKATQASPPKAAPLKTVVKALPTVRDHTTDQLGPDGDEYLPRESDEAGERKVNANGHPLDGREYKCRTFFVPNRRDKLFMLATECARVLGYRDSYLLFNKNRSLFKIIATQSEKDDLIHQEILPYSYRSRQIAIVTAKSMFRQFGSRVIVNGRRVRDDYWESKARKQGFTEEDLAGEKRPGAAKARDAAALEAATAGAAAPAHTDVVYSNGPAHLESHLQPQTVQPGVGGPAATSLAPLPMILPPTDDMRVRDYGNVPRPRQEISGQPYQDRTTASTTSDILNQAQHTAEFNKALGQQRGARGKYLEDFWSKPRESPVSGVGPQESVAGSQVANIAASAGALRNSPQIASGGLFAADTQTQQAQPSPHALPPPQPHHHQHQQHQHQQQQQQQQQHQQQQHQQQQAAMPQQHHPRGPPQMLSQHQAAYPQQQQQHPHIPLSQSPIRSMPAGSIRPDQMHHRSPSLSLAGHPGQPTPANPYGQPYPHHAAPMWPPSAQAHQSSLSQPHHPMAGNYSAHASAPPATQHQSAHQQHQQQPGHPGPAGHQSMGGSGAVGLQYGGMSAGLETAAGSAGGYHPGPGGVRSLYQAAGTPAAQQHFLQQQQHQQQQQQQQQQGQQQQQQGHHQQTSSGPHVQPAMQGWAPPHGGHGQQQQSPHGSGGQWGWSSGA